MALVNSVLKLAVLSKLSNNFMVNSPASWEEFWFILNKILPPAFNEFREGVISDNFFNNLLSVGIHFLLIGKINFFDFIAEIKYVFVELTLRVQKIFAF